MLVCAYCLNGVNLDLQCKLKGELETTEGELQRIQFAAGCILIAATLTWGGRICLPSLRASPLPG